MQCRYHPIPRARRAPALVASKPAPQSPEPVPASPASVAPPHSGASEEMQSPSGMASAASGVVATDTTRQSNVSISAPPITGPKAGEMASRRANRFRSSRVSPAFGKDLEDQQHRHGLDQSCAGPTITRPITSMARSCAPATTLPIMSPAHRCREARAHSERGDGPCVQQHETRRR